MPEITFSTCFYILKSKFDANQYCVWAENFIGIANNFNLVIYTDEYSSKFINTRNKPNIRVIIKPVEQFHNYKYRDYWIANHKKNDLLNKRIEWQVNMLWSEKVWFVHETVSKKYFDTEYYGYCDIGYFRNESNDMHTNFLSAWPSKNKILTLDKSKIHYALVNNNLESMNDLFHLIRNTNELGLPVTEIPPYQKSVAGGFFIIVRDKIDWWATTYDAKLKLYFENEYLVKDDQMIVIDCIMSNLKQFQLHEEHSNFDNWFMFQRLLL
jgi:hypothetical protein